MLKHNLVRLGVAYPPVVYWIQAEGLVTIQCMTLYYIEYTSETHQILQSQFNSITFYSTTVCRLPFWKYNDNVF